MFEAFASTTGAFSGWRTTCEDSRFRLRTSGLTSLVRSSVLRQLSKRRPLPSASARCSIGRTSSPPLTRCSGLCDFKSAETRSRDSNRATWTESSLAATGVQHSGGNADCPARKPTVDEQQTQCDGGGSRRPRAGGSARRETGSRAAGAVTGMNSVTSITLLPPARTRISKKTMYASAVPNRANAPRASQVPAPGAASVQGRSTTATTTAMTRVDARSWQVADSSGATSGEVPATPQCRESVAERSRETQARFPAASHRPIAPLAG